MTGSACLDFVYGRPVCGDEFLDRDSELRTIFNRLRNCESSAVVGESHIGKTSLLLQLADEKTQREYLGEDRNGVVFSPVDLHSIPLDYCPAQFWAEVLEPLQEHADQHARIKAHLARAAETNYARRSLERLFNDLSQQQHQLVLLKVPPNVKTTKRPK